MIIDRFESYFAIVELPDGDLIYAMRKLFGDAKEGDIVDIIVNYNETAERKGKSKQTFDKLKK